MTDNFGVSSDPEIFEVEKIIDSAIIDGEEKFLIRWAGYNEDYDTWEPVQNLEGCEQKLEEFLESRTRLIEKNKESKKKSQKNKKPSSKSKKNTKKKASSKRDEGEIPVSQPVKMTMTFSESSSSDSDASQSSMLDFLTSSGMHDSPPPPSPITTTTTQEKSKSVRAKKERSSKATKSKPATPSNRAKTSKESPKSKNKSSNSISKVTQSPVIPRKCSNFVFRFNADDEKKLPLQTPVLQNQRALYHIVDSKYQFPSDFQLLSRIQRINDVKIINGKREVLVQWAEEGAQEMWLPYEAVLGMDPQLLLDCLLEMYIEKKSEK